MAKNTGKPGGGKSGSDKSGNGGSASPGKWEWRRGAAMPAGPRLEVPGRRREIWAGTASE